MNIIAHNKLLLDQDEISALEKVVRSGWIIGGPQVKKFEETLSEMHNLKYGVAVNSGTAAIHLSLLALEITKGDEVILPTYAPSDLLNAINYTGATPVIVDIELDSPNMDPKNVEKKISKKTKAILVPHIFGVPAKIRELERFGIPIINDSAQSLGTTYLGKPVGSYGDLVILSFYATKLITTGQGGMVLTNNKRYQDFVRDIIDYNGRDSYKVRFNYPLTDLAAACGNIQLKKLDYFLKRRKEIGKKYYQALKNKKVKFWPVPNDNDSNYYRFVLKFERKNEREQAKKLFEKNRISTIIPINEYELLHNCLGLPKSDYPIAQDACLTTLSIPIYPALKDSEVEKVMETLKDL